MPSASHGVGHAIAHVPIHDSASSAPSASVCGPPPEPPIDANRSTPNVSSTSEMSFATAATSRPELGDEPP